MRLQDKTVLITGAGVRLGRAMSVALAQRGCHVAIHYRLSKREAQETAGRVRQSGREAVVLRADLSKPEQVQTLAERSLEYFGHVDILINNAALFYATPFLHAGEEDWNTIMDVNLRAPFLLCQKLAPKMLERREGKIVNLADISVWKPWADYLPYCISKAGVVALTLGLARALAPHVQVNAIAPGTVLPPIDEGENIEALARQTLLQRIGSPEDIVAALLFLLEGSDFVTGQVLTVDGGRVLL
ncbi:MAG: SDR family oxidoreductase [Acidobacteria bacterium]|nr:SDR family oxidoreductase [Acidobacteriota bacterium]